MQCAVCSVEWGAKPKAKLVAELITSAHVASDMLGSAACGRTGGRVVYLCLMVLSVLTKMAHRQQCVVLH
jgi:hypothetical protein